MALLGLIATALVLAGLAWKPGRGLKRQPLIAQKPAIDKLDASLKVNDASPTKPVVIGKPAQPPAKAPRSPSSCSALMELRAYKLWVERGRLKGKAGESMREKNWLDAEHQILEEVEARAFKIWDEQGRPSAAAGEAVRELNRRAAEAQLLKETDDEFRRHPLD